jgi:microcin C transport system permease protein
MLAYIIRRLLLIPLTLVGIITINFFIVQIAPGGPVEQMLAELQGTALDATSSFSGVGASELGGTDTGGGSGGRGESTYQGARGLDPDFIAEIERQFGFDKPIHERYLTMLVDYASFDLGESYFRSTGVLALIWEKMPVSVPPSSEAPTPEKDDVASRAVP